MRRTAPWLAERGCATPRLDAEVLLAHVLGVPRIALYTDHERPLVPAEVDAFRELVRRRGRREPVAHLTGRRAFRMLDLEVGPDVLVPRPETETLVEWALAAAPRGARVFDWGTGSGAVAVALATERPDLTVTAGDVSSRALATARRNGAAAGAAVEWVEGDGFGPVAGRVFDVVVANPPYLSEADMAEAPPELAFEPRGALVSGPDGLEAVRAIAAAAPAHLAPGGLLLVEVGAGQAAGAADALAAAGLRREGVRDDLAGIGRVVGARAAGAGEPRA